MTDPPEEEGLTSPVESSIGGAETGTQVRNVEAGAEAQTEECCPVPHHGLPSLLLTKSRRTSQGGITHRGLYPPTSAINKESGPQVYPQTHLTEKTPQHHQIIRKCPSNPWLRYTLPIRMQGLLPGRGVQRQGGLLKCTQKRRRAGRPHPGPAPHTPKSCCE